MATKVIMKNAQTGQIKSGYFGFSWTYLFFGWWVPLIRGELGVAALHLLFTIFTFGLWQLIIAFLYNKQYTGRLMEKGFRLVRGDPLADEAARRLNIDLATHFHPAT